MNRLIVSCTLILCLIIIAIPSQAKLTITPQVTITEVYNNNIFLTRSDREHDYITSIYPKIIFDYSDSKLIDFNLDYGLNFRFYSEHSNLNDTSIRETQNIILQSQVRPHNRITIDISDVYGRVPVDVRESFAIDNAVVNMTENNEFSISPYLTYPLTTTITSTIGYAYSNSWYDDDNLADYESHSAYVSVNKRFTSKMSSTLRYNYYLFNDLSEVPNTVDEYDRHEGSVRIDYQATTAFSINGEIGRAKTNFDIEDNIDNTFWNIGADYNFSASRMNATYIYALFDSATAGAYRRNRVDFTYELDKALTLSINPYHYNDDYVNINREDKVSGVVLTLSRSLTDKIDALVDLDYEKQKFQPEDERVRRFSVGTSLKYSLSRSITASAGYRYNGRNSDVDIEDFHNNIVWLQAEVVF